MVNNFMGKIGHGGFLNMKYSGHGDDWVELAIDWREDLVGDPGSGVIASAVVISLLDNATSMALWQRRGEFVPQVTMDLRLDYLRPSPSGQRVYGRGICYHISRSVGFVRGIAHNGDMDDPLAYASGTFIRLGGWQ
ncbi:MAG: PaaI family thioesterase [Sphingomonadales bacterium]|nr:PaaI family thioesterase [Sphingomonadales bacterium]